jgi:hypothetical protein
MSRRFPPPWSIDGKPDEGSQTRDFPTRDAETKMNADHLPDETPIRPLGGRMVCSRCGYRGADVRPDWPPHTNRRPF